MILNTNNELHTPVFPSKSLDKSENLIHRFDHSIIKIEDTKIRIAKQGNQLLIGTNSINIEKKTVQEVVKILISSGIEASLYSALHLLPAIMINDFDNSYSNILEPNTNPVDLIKIYKNEYFKITNTSKPILRDLKVFSKDKLIKHQLINSTLYFKNEESVRIYYTLLYENFDITITSNTFGVSTSSMLYRIENAQEVLRKK